MTCLASLSVQGEQTALSLRRLITGLISTVESQSLAALSSLSAAATASADFEPPAEVEWGGSVHWLKSFQTHLMARAGHWLQMQAQEQLNKGSSSGSAAAAAAAGGSGRDQKQASSDSKLMTTDGFDADEAADAKALELKTGKEEKDSKKNDAPEPAVSAVTRTTDRVFGVVVEYAVLLSGAMQRLMTEYGRQLQSVKAQSIAVQWKVAKSGLTHSAVSDFVLLLGTDCCACRTTLQAVRTCCDARWWVSWAAVCSTLWPHLCHHPPPAIDRTWVCVFCRCSLSCCRSVCVVSVFVW